MRFVTRGSAVPAKRWAELKFSYLPKRPARALTSQTFALAEISQATSLRNHQGASRPLVKVSKAFLRNQEKKAAGVNSGTTHAAEAIILVMR